MARKLLRAMAPSTRDWDDLDTREEIETKLTLHERIEGQLDSLAVACESVGLPGGRLATSVPQAPEQWARCLRAIAKGGEWENGGWK